MTGNRQHRAILFTDIVGYSSLAYKNEVIALGILQENNRIVREMVKHFNGCERKQTGDGFFVDFESVQDAVNCAIEVQRAIRERNSSLPVNQQFQNRIAIHYGEVTEVDGDAFGHDVNLTARSESYAPPGGVAITQVALDHLCKDKAIGHSSLGHKKFKNIPESVELFSLEMPWSGDVEESRRGVFVNWEMIKELLSSDNYKIGKINLFDAFLSVGMSALALGVVLGLHNYTGQYTKHRDGNFPIVEGWSFTLSSESTTVNEISKSNKTWKPIDITKTWSSPDELHGNYWLKNEFSIEPNALSKTPSFILGLVSESHEVYLNGKFIGGSDKFTELTNFPFDISLLNKDGQNTFLIKAVSDKTLNPGVKYLPEVGAYIGDYTHTREALRSNSFNYHVVRYIYLAMSFLFMMMSVFYYLFYRHKKHLRYFALYFMFGGIMSLYFTPWISDVLPYYLKRYMKAVSVNQSVFMMFSAYLYLIGRPRLERLTNLAALFSFGVVSALLLREGDSMNSYVVRYDLVLQATGYISLATLGFMLWHIVSEMKQVFGRKRLYTYESVYSSACFVASIFLSVFVFSATHDGFITEVSRTMRSILGDVGTFFPMVLMPVLVVMIVLEHSLDNLKFRKSLERDRLLLDIGREFRECRDVELIIEYTLDKICKFVGVARSTVYIKDDSKDGVLTARCKYGSEDRTDLVKYEISEKEGVIGYVYRSGQLLVIDDINSDPRFKNLYKNRSEVKFKTGSCMIVPLIYLGDLVGVMTIADKKNGRIFSSSDVRLMLSIGKDLALMIGTSSDLYKSEEAEMRLSS